MKDSTKNVLIAIGIAFTIVLILFIFLFIVFYVFSVLEKNAEHDKLQHCVPLIDDASRLENELNVTHRFWKSPTEYKQLANKCEQAINCVTKHESSVSTDVLHTFSPCQFYVFYYRNFSTCAEKLFAKKDDGIDCLNALFNDDPNVDKCEQWDSIQECVKSQIKSTCHQLNGTVMVNYEKEASNFRPSICTVL